MPFTPYHFGPSGFVGLVFRRWIDVPVFVLANVIIDLEVLFIIVFRLGWPFHRYFHTLLFGALIGALWGVAAYPLRRLFGEVMRLCRLSYETTLPKMAISGMLGACMHVLIDGAYHNYSTVFWPSTSISLHRILRLYISREQGMMVCVAFLIAAVVYLLALVTSTRNAPERDTNDEGEHS